jgi:diguanylate cyclase (GGDEF)-like protein
MKVITTKEEFSALKPVWNNLLEESGVDSIFLTYEWISSWLEVFGKEGDMLILKGEGEGWKGIFPLFRRVRSLPLGKLRTVSFIGEPLSDRCDFIIAGDRSKAIDAFLSYCRQHHSDCDLLRLRQIPIDSPTARLLKKKLIGGKMKFNYRVCDRAPYIPLPDSWNDYFQTRSRSFKKKIRKYFRAIREEGEIRIDQLPLSPEIWDILLGISGRSPKSQRGVAFFSPPGMTEFMKILLPRMRESGLLKLTGLYLNDRPIAYDIGFKYHDKIWSYESAFDRKYASAGVGHLLLTLLVEDAIKDNCREFDLLRGDEAYKFSWADRRREHLEFIIYHPGLLPDLIRWGYRFKRIARFLVRKEFRFFGEKGVIEVFRQWLSLGPDRSGRELSVTATTRKGGLHLKVLTELGEVRDLEGDWNRLLAQSGIGSIFMTYEWIISWLEVYGKGGEIMVLAAYRGAALIGIFPLILRKGKFVRYPVRMIEFAGDPQSDSTDLILPEKKEEVIELFWDYLWECRSRWSVIRLREIPGDSLNLTILGDLLLERKIPHYFRTCSQSPFITLDKKWDDYLKSRSKSFRYKIRRDLRRLKKGKELQLREVSPTPEVWETIFDINCKSRKADRGINMFAGQATREFMKRVAGRFKGCGWLNIRLLFCNEIAIAYQIDFIYKNKSCYYNSAFLPNYDRYHPGYLIQGLNIKENILKGRRELDLLRGDEQYKFFYTNEIRYHREIDIFNKTLIPSCLRLIYAVKEAIKRLRGGKYVARIEHINRVPAGKTIEAGKNREMKPVGKTNEVEGKKTRERILIVDDDPVILKKLRHIITSAGYRVSSAINGKEAIDRMKEEVPDLIISDIMMPEMDGYEFCRHVRSHPATALLPFIFLTAKDKIDDRIEGIRLGADAYLTKAFHPSELLATVRTALLRHQLYLEQAQVDELTGLPNRKGIMDELTEQITIARQYQRPFSLAMIDLDNFKTVNDQYGHQAGDQILRQFAGLLSREVRERDTVGRWGGEEFLVLLPETSESDARALLEVIREKVADFNWKWEKGRSTVPITMSAGVAELRASDQDINEIIDRADRALYQAKNRGKNQVVVSGEPGE